MQNVKVTCNESTMTIEVDLTQEELSASGKSYVVATTRGLQPVDEDRRYAINFMLIRRLMGEWREKKGVA